MKLHKLLSDPSKWTKKAIARDANNNKVGSGDPTAVCFCLIGAVFKLHPFSFDDRQNLYEKIETKVPRGDIVGWNDAPERTHEEVLALLKELDI